MYLDESVRNAWNVKGSTGVGFRVVFIGPRGGLSGIAGVYRTYDTASDVRNFLNDRKGK